MAYYGKRRYKRKMAQRKKRVYRKGKTTLRALNAKVNKALKMSKQGLVRHHLYQNITDIDPVVAPYNYYNLTQWNNMSSVFGTALVDWAQSNKVFLNKMTIHYKLEQATESDNISTHFFLVSLKDAANTTSRFNASTGALSLNSGTDYAMLNGRCFLNPRVFNIIRHKRVYFTNGGQALSTSGAGDKNLVVHDGKWVISPKHYVSNGSSNVRDMVCSQDPNKCFYLLAFTDNVLSDLTANQLSINVHYSITTAN